MNTYTPSTGNTPQGQQLAQGQPNAANTQPPPGSPATAYPSDQQLNQSYSAANQTLVNQGTPDKRQQYITNSNLPAMQSNYDDLAKQLFEYDSSVLSPKFQGQNPGTPTDAASFGRVDASPLGMTVGSAGLPASSGIYNPNPKYAYTAQIDQGNNIANLLTTLLGGMGKEFGSRVGQYKSDTQGAQSALDSVFKIMQLKQDAEDKANARSGTGVGSDLKSADAYQQMKDAYVAQQQKSGKHATYDGLWDFMNTQKNALAAAGYDMDLIYKLQGQDRSMFGGNGDVTSGKPNIYKPNDPMKQYKVTSSKSPKGVVQWKVDKGGTGVWTVTDDSGFFGRKPTLSPDEIVTYGRSQGEADDVIKKSLVYAGYTVK